jgi:hypothetical protein
MWNGKFKNQLKIRYYLYEIGSLNLIKQEQWMMYY